MDAIELLSRDHREIDKLFEQIEKTDNRGANHCELLFHELRRQLELHTRVEEKTFYLEMETLGPTKALVSDALQQHGEIKQMLEEIAGLSSEDDQWSEMINELKLAVQQHVREEEGQMFPAARHELDQSHLDALGRQIEEKKQNAGA